MKEKTIKMPNSFGKEIEVTKKEWTARWQDKSLRGFFLEDEYFKLQNRIKELELEPGSLEGRRSSVILYPVILGQG